MNTLRQPGIGRRIVLFGVTSLLPLAACGEGEPAPYFNDDGSAVIMDIEETGPGAYEATARQCGPEREATYCAEETLTLTEAQVADIAVGSVVQLQDGQIAA
jgi:hypothetical protein